MYWFMHVAITSFKGTLQLYLSHLLISISNMHAVVFEFFQILFLMII